jgi:hypothetical protein
MRVYVRRSWLLPLLSRHPQLAPFLAVSTPWIDNPLRVYSSYRDGALSPARLWVFCLFARMVL